ncbi:hypothetical protein TCAL_00755 [Tigriopus californicus]|uniref:Gamma-interferon-inducible lysosomal thiol reductase n=2 Tax=Tigriopus californicus TaxID=6832 RepID=A0A553PA11_TIGCA|nr:hypothetical protein TCAL_00755 [Tigriopus californicus]
MTSLNLLTAPGSKKVAMARSPGLRAYAFRVLALVIFLFTLWLLYSHLGHHGAHQALPHGNQPEVSNAVNQSIMLFLSLNITYLLALLTYYNTPRPPKAHTPPTTQISRSDDTSTSHSPLLLAALTTTPLPKSGKVVVEVYYEVLCPDSRYFILKQLYPTWQRVGSIMDIQYKPYGKASHRASDGGYMFQCQHGPNECQGNMIHTCAMHYIPESTKLTEYIHCMMGDNYDPMQAGRNCASQLEIEWSPIEACASGKEGQKMLAVVGDDTHSLRPRVSFIPTIVLNGSQDNQKMMLKNLLKEVCRKYQGVKPKECIETL